MSASLLSALGLGSVPVMWVFVALNVATQYVCICGVYMLLEARDPLSVNVLLTVRKAASVVFSVLIFGNTFTLFHMAGATLVFGASLAFMAEPPTLSAAPALGAAAPAAAGAGAAAEAPAAAAAAVAAASGGAASPSRKGAAAMAEADDDASGASPSSEGEEAVRLRGRSGKRRISVGPAALG